MNILYIDCRSGASGDMFLGAFVDLGVPERVLTEGLASLGLNEFSLDIKKKDYHGIMVTDVDVVVFDKENLRVYPYSGKFRNYKEIKDLISASAIPDTAKILARKIFDIKADAESKAHGIPIDEVQFHEAGAIDSIVDIIGAAICYDYLSVDKAFATPVPTGFGTIQLSWGELPVPPPAVQNILADHDIPHFRSDVEMELLTPTGASILAGITQKYIDASKMPENINSSDIQETAEEGDAILCGRGTGKRDSWLPPLTLILQKE
ncbi:MAG: LarC family nickel insertion protein [Firmicutes bacterium]|nr:LarC family nickel insertion protein [Bacillota bacterium]